MMAIGEWKLHIGDRISKCIIKIYDFDCKHAIGERIYCKNLSFFWHLCDVFA